MHILPIQIGLIQSNLSWGRTENKAEQIVGLVGAGVAFIPKDEKGRVKNDFSSLLLLLKDKNAEKGKKQKYEKKPKKTKAYKNTKMQ